MQVLGSKFSVEIFKEKIQICTNDLCENSWIVVFLSFQEEKYFELLDSV